MEFIYDKVLEVLNVFLSMSIILYIYRFSKDKTKFLEDKYILNLEERDLEIIRLRDRYTIDIEKKDLEIIQLKKMSFPEAEKYISTLKRLLEHNKDIFDQVKKTNLRLENHIENQNTALENQISLVDSLLDINDTYLKKIFAYNEWSHKDTIIIFSLLNIYYNTRSQLADQHIKGLINIFINTRKYIIRSNIIDFFNRIDKQEGLLILLIKRYHDIRHDTIKDFFILLKIVWNPAYLNQLKAEYKSLSCTENIMKDSLKNFLNEIEYK